MTEWDKVTKEAMLKALEEGNVDDSYECPTCGTLGTISLWGNKAFCHLCETDLEIGECPICHKLAIDTESDLEGNIYHWKCLDDYARSYIEEMWRER